MTSQEKQELSQVCDKQPYKAKMMKALSPTQDDFSLEPHTVSEAMATQR